MDSESLLNRHTPSVIPTSTFIPRKPVPSLPSYDSSRRLLPNDDLQQPIQPEILSPQIATEHRDLSDVSNTSETEKSFIKTKRMRSRLRPHQSWWKYEILAATISILSMAALVGLLYHYNGTVARRLGHGITLNGVVAVLATVCRTCLMIPVASGLSQGKWLWFSVDRAPENGRRLEDLEVLDNASRGSWGSLELLWTLRGRDILSLGAVITVLALAFDAFTQQVLTTQYTNTIDDLASPSELNVPRSTSYNISRNLDNSGENKVPDWSTYAAIYNGMLATNMSHLPAPCTTGNCTWPITPSLGVCGECQPLKWSAPEICTGSTYDPSGDRSCVYTLPDDQTLRVGKGDYVNIFQVSLSDGVSYNASSKTVPYILNFETIGMPYGAPAWDASLISAQECALWYCIQAYNISVTSNQLDQRMVETWSQATFPPDPEGEDVNGTIEFTDIPSSMNVNRGVEYSVGVNSWHGAQAGFQNIFSQGLIQAGSGGTFNKSVWIDALWAGWGNDSDMSQLISNVALSMTNNIQQTSPATTSEPRYAGTAYRERLLVQVRWEWLSLPVALVLFSVVFLIVIILKTRSVGVMAWKGSALALLFSGVDEELKENSKSALGRPNGLVKATSESRVALREKDGLWEFENSGSRC